MIIKAMPVLHARTYNIDFRTGKLLIEPESFSNYDSECLYQIAVESTRQREMAPTCGRFVVYGAGTYSVVGRTVRFSDLYSSCNKEPKFCTVDHKEGGRTAYGFVGLMISTGSVEKPFALSDELILDVYERCIEKRWNETDGDEGALETKKMGYLELDVSPLSEQPSYEPLLRNSDKPVILEDSEDSRKQIVYSAMLQAFSGKKVSLCTSVARLDGNVFKVTTCKNAASKSKMVSDAIEQIESVHFNSKSLQRAHDRNDDRKGNDSFGKGRMQVALPNKAVEIPRRKREQSLNDLLSSTTAPNDDGESFQKSYKKNQTNVTDTGLILGTVFGITFVVVEIAKNTSPILLAITSAFTIVVGGFEAKRIIDKFKM